MSGTLFLYTSCDNCNKTTESDTLTSNLSVDVFLKDAEKFAGKEIQISGTVSHVCRHSGKKMFVFGDNPQQTVKINTGGEVSSFDINLEGTEVEITGTVIEDVRIDEAYLNEWEDEIIQMVGDKDVKVCNAESQAISGQQGDTASVDQAEEEDPFAAVKEFRKKLAESGKTYISVYAVDCKSLKSKQ